MNTEWKSEIDNIEVEHVITPFIQNDEDALINRCIKGNGGKAIFSQLESIRIAGYSNDPEETLKQIQEEDKATQQTREIACLKVQNNHTKNNNNEKVYWNKTD